MSKFETADRQKMQQLLKQELEHFETLYKECTVQSSLLGENKVDELEASLDKAQGLREKINGLHQEIQVLMQSYFSTPQNEKDAEIDKLLGQVRAVTEKCAKLNTQNMDSAKAAKTELKQKIDEQSAKRKGIGGYAQAVTSSPELFDTKQ